MMLDEAWVFAHIIGAEVFDGLVDHLMVRPQPRFAIADDARVGINAHKQKTVNQKGCNPLDLHVVLLFFVG